jgi:hypothetical protein
MPIFFAVFDIMTPVARMVLKRALREFPRAFRIDMAL